MMPLTIISVGKLKEKYYCDAQNEYVKRLSRYCDLKLIEILPEALPQIPSAAQIDAALLKEAERIEKQIPKNAFCAALCVEGTEISSEEFSKKISRLKNDGKAVCFIIGSSYGLCDSVKKRCDLKLSVSKMTFPHRLFKIMLLEQIYRAFKIDEGGTYHK